MPIPVPLIAAGANALFSGITGLFQNRKANKIKPVDPVYKISPYAQDQYALARLYLNGRMAGATQQEQNILASQGNMLANVQRNAGDSGQALAMAAAGQSQTTQALADLGATEAQNKAAMLGNYNQAAGTMINEGDKVYQDQLRKYNNAVEAKNALRNAAWQNIGQGVNGLTGLAALYGGEIGKPKMQKGVMPKVGLASQSTGPNTMGVFGNMQYNPAWLNNMQKFDR